MGMFVKSNSGWKPLKGVFVKTNSGWKSVKKAFVKTLNGWAAIWPSSGPVAVYEVDLSSSKSSYPSSGTSYPILTGTTYHWDSTLTISLSYVFQSSSSSSGPWTTIKSGSYIANPQSGSTSSVTYTPSLNDYPAGSTYFNFVVTATDGNNNFNVSSSASQYDTIVTLPAPTWTSTIPRIGGQSASGKTITWNIGKATISGSSSSVGYYTTIYKSSPAGTITYLYGNSTAPDFESTDDYQYSISIPSTDAGYTYYFTTYAAQSLIVNPVLSTSYSNNVTIITSPAIVTNPSVTKYDGYQTVGYRLQGNTGTWNQAMDNYYWGWQYCPTNSSNPSDWKLIFSNSSLGSGQSGFDSSENQNHIFTIPQYVYLASNPNPVNIAGGYINFYSLADKNSISAPVPPLQVVGPIYNAPGTAGTPTAYFSRGYNAGYSYIKFYWLDATYHTTYTVQYNNAGTWTDLGSTTLSTYNGTFVSPLELLVPVGTWDFRVKTVNDEGIATYSSTTSFTVTSPYNFAFGNTIYPNTNGQIGLDSGWSYSSIPPAGRTIGVYGLDLYQQSVGYWSDGRYFVVQYSGWAYGQTNVPAYAIRYQVRFDTLNTNYADVLICNKGSSLSQPSYIGYYANGSLQSGVQGPYVLATNSSYRIYFDGTTGTLGNSFTQIPSADFIVTSLSSGTLDDGYSTITAYSNQYTSSYFTNISGSIANNTLTFSFTGNIDYSTYYYRLDTGTYGGANVSNATFATSNPLVVSNLTPGQTYYLTIQPANSLGQYGTSYQNYYLVPNAPSAFTTISGAKAYPTGAVQSPSEPSQSRTLSTYWNTSTNASYYEVQYEGSNDNSTWTVLQSLAGAPYLSSNSDAYVAVYYRYYRYSVRARDAAKNLTTAAYSDGGSSGSLNYYYITGSNPSNITISSVTPGTGSSYASATVSYAFPSNPGSNTIDWNYWSLDNATWNQVYGTTFTISSLSASTGYYVYMRSMNYDMLYSGSTYQYFTTNAAPVYYTVTWNANGGTVSPASSTQSTVGGSVTAPTPTLSGYSFNGWYNAASGGSLIVNGGGSYTPSSNTTLYAQWTYIHVYPTISPTLSVSSITTTSAVISWSQTNAYYDYLNGTTYLGLATSTTLTGLSPSTAYSGSVTVYSTTGDTATGYYSFTTAAAGVKPSAPTGLYGSNDIAPHGGHFYFTASATGTAPITYYFTVTKSTTLTGTYSAYSSSSTTGTSISVASTGYFKCSVYASNAYGTSTTVSTSTGVQFT